MKCLHMGAVAPLHNVRASRISLCTQVNTWATVSRVHLSAWMFTLGISVMTAAEACGQYPSDAPSLHELALKGSHDTTRAQAMLFLATLLQDDMLDSAAALCIESMRIVETFLGTNSLTGVVRKPKEKKAARRIKATCLLNLGHYSRSLGKTLDAQNRYDLAWQQFEKAEFQRGARDALVAMGDLLKQSGAIAEGHELIKRAEQRYGHAPHAAYGSISYRPKTELLTQGGTQPNTAATKSPSLEGFKMNEPLREQPSLDEGQTGATSAGADSPAAIAYRETALVDFTLRNDSTLQVANSNSPLVRLGIDTAVISLYRARLTKPLRVDGGILEAHDNMERGEALELIRASEEAMAAFVHSLNVFRKLGSDTGECIALLRIGKLQGENGDHQGAFAVLDSARQKARAIGRRDLEGIALAAMGDMCRSIEECGIASDLYRRSIEKARAAGDRRTEAKGYLGISEELVVKGSLQEAEPLGKKGFDIATDIDDADLRLQGAEILRGVYARLGRMVEAKEMGVLSEHIDAFIAERDRTMDSIIASMRSEMLRVRAQDSLAHREVRTALEANLTDERVKVRKSRKTTLLMGAAAVLAAVVGVVFFRYDRRRRQLRAERRAMDLEIKALRAQMNPHFLFNALNSIHDHILEHDPEEAADYLAKFSKLIRQVLELSRMNEVTLDRELEVLGMYAELERLRLRNRFTYEVDITREVDAGAITLPPMLLQPFVENAIWHGLSRKQGQGHLRVLVSQVGASLRIVIEDDGVGRPVDVNKENGHRSLGTSITKERLDLWTAQRGGRSNFAYVPVPAGTRVEIELPLGEW